MEKSGWVERRQWAKGGPKKNIIGILSSIRRGYNSSAKKRREMGVKKRVRNEWVRLKKRPSSGVMGVAQG